MFKNQQKGFTLIELAIVMVIIGIISIAAISTYYASLKKATFESIVSEVVSTIKDMRNTSIVGTFTQNGSDLVTNSAGYGVYLSISPTGSTLISFQDSNGDKVFNASDDTLLSTYLLPEEGEITTMSGTKATDYTAAFATNDSFDEATILFMPPQGETILNENDSTKQLVDISIEIERYDGHKSKKLKINKISGFIESE